MLYGEQQSATLASSSRHTQGIRCMQFTHGASSLDSTSTLYAMHNAHTPALGETMMSPVQLCILVASANHILQAVDGSAGALQAQCCCTESTAHSFNTASESHCPARLQQPATHCRSAHRE
jgi:hypothetical protein